MIRAYEKRLIAKDEAIIKLQKLGSIVRYSRNILDKLKWFVQNIENIPLLPLHGKYAGFFKLKAGDWRVIYEVNHRVSLQAVF